MKMTVLYSILIVLAAACSKSNQEETPVLPVEPVVKRIVNVSTSTELHAALLNAKPGDEIILADGVYNGKFVVAADKDGSKTNYIMLRGSKNAVLNAGSVQTGYVLHLQADYWMIQGISITNGLKGIMADGVRYNIIDAVTVFNIGEEGIHLRKFSSQNRIENSTITNTGLKTPDFGEGIYIGSAKSNWTTYTNGLPDRCDSNLIHFNTIGPGVTAESIDIKEGTTGGTIALNHFDATGIIGANSGDSWMDVKGNNYLIEYNSGFNPAGSMLKDGFQVNVAVSGWGNNNEFLNNDCTVNASGYGFNIKLTSSTGTAVGNKVYSNNQVTNAASGISNIALSN
jgi:hypothetical protein